jgi:hypothetical protein
VVTLLSFYFKIYCGLLVKTKLKIKNNWVEWCIYLTE